MMASQAVKLSLRSVVGAKSFSTSAASRALTKFTMPAMSPTMTEGGITAWKKKEGEKFSTGDVLLELETDKATMDVEAQDEGIMVKILVGDGTKGVPVGKVVAITGEEGDPLEGEEVDKLAKESADEGASQDKGKQQDVEVKEGEKPQEKADEKPSKPSPSTPSDPEPASESSSAPSKPAEYVFASPIAKRLAAERGIPLKSIKGTGPNGRIVKADVEGHKGAPAQASAGAAAPGPAPTVATPYEDIPLSSMRKVIAQRLTESKQAVPHYYVTSELKVDRLLKLREVFNNAAKQASEAGSSSAKATAKLSVNDFFVKALAQACIEVPEANSAWIGNGTIRQYKKVDVSVAVATPTGLITPIVTGAEGRGLASISYATKELAKKARDGKLKPEEYQGGTFTISNLGMFGSVTDFTAIINPPQACILAVGGTEEKVVVDESSEKGFKAIQTIKVTLSADHRVVDGAVGARWMKAFKDLIENPISLLL